MPGCQPATTSCRHEQEAANVDQPAAILWDMSLVHVCIISLKICTHKSEHAQ